LTIGASQQTTGNPAEGQGSRSAAPAAPPQSPRQHGCSWLTSPWQLLASELLRKRAFGQEKSSSVGGWVGRMVTGSGCILPIPAPKPLVAGPSPPKYPREGNS